MSDINQVLSMLYEVLPYGHCYWCQKVKPSAQNSAIPFSILLKLIHFIIIHVILMTVRQTLLYDTMCYCLLLIVAVYMLHVILEYHNLISHESYEVGRILSYIGSRLTFPKTLTAICQSPKKHLIFSCSVHQHNFSCEHYIVKKVMMTYINYLNTLKIMVAVPEIRKIPEHG